MSTHMIQPPFAFTGAMPTSRPWVGRWQRAWRSFLRVCDAIGRERAERELHMLAMRWDHSSPELARQARLAAARCAAMPARD
jgi:hypothetical protein